VGSVILIGSVKMQCFKSRELIGERRRDSNRSIRHAAIILVKFE
jgi:hypothetical protein